MIGSLQSEQDEIMIQQAGDDIDVPDELVKMVDGDAPQEEEKESIMQNLQNMDMDQLKEKAQATFVEMKSKAEEKCTVMWCVEDFVFINTYKSSVNSSNHSL